MKISIFKEVAPHPNGRDQKSKEATKATHPVTVSFRNDEELISYVSGYAWSPFVFREKRLASHFISTDLLVYDIDEGLTIQQAEAIVEQNGLCCLCLPSPSHTDHAHRFRLILPLSKTITNTTTYQTTWNKGAELFKTVDDQCKDLARLFFACRTNDGFWIEGKLFDPIEPKIALKEEGRARPVEESVPVSEDIKEVVEWLYGPERHSIPDSVDYFIKNAGTGLPGHWINTLNSTVFSLALSEVEDDKIWSFCEKFAPQALDNKDKYQINRSITDGKKEVAKGNYAKSNKKNI